MNDIGHKRKNGDASAERDDQLFDSYDDMRSSRKKNLDFKSMMDQFIGPTQAEVQKMKDKARTKIGLVVQTQRGYEGKIKHFRIEEHQVVFTVGYAHGDEDCFENDLTFVPQEKVRKIRTSRNSSKTSLEMSEKAASGCSSDAAPSEASPPKTSSETLPETSSEYGGTVERLELECDFSGITDLAGAELDILLGLENISEDELQVLAEGSTEFNQGTHCLAEGLAGPNSPACPNSPAHSASPTPLTSEQEDTFFNGFFE